MSIFELSIIDAVCDDKANTWHAYMYGHVVIKYFYTVVIFRLERAVAR